MNTPRVQIVDETDLGLYLWQMPDGKLVADEDKNFLNIPARKGDQSKMDILSAAAASLGINEGKPVFWAGNRRVTDEEYEYQKQRMEWGLVPDEQDFGAARDELLMHQKGVKK
jgi:hypothetical protein